MTRPALPTALLACLLTVRCATPLSAADAATLADLRALDRQQNYAEMLGRLKDVRPALRDAEWEALVEKATVAELDRQEVKDAPSGELALRVMKEHLVAFPSLRQSRSYLARRAELGLVAFGWTYSSYRHSVGDEEWVPQVLAFAEADTATPGLAQRMARELVLKRLVASSSWPLYQLALRREGDAVCADVRLPDVVLDLIEARSFLEELQALVTGRCAAQLKGPVVERLRKGDSSSFRKGACAVLAGQRDLGDVLKACLP